MTTPLACPIVDSEGVFLKWVYALTGQCFGSRSEIFSLLASVFSVAGWLLAGIYQIRANYRAKDASGFSFYFLVCWLIGDLNNIAGCFITHQMLFQRTLSLISLCVDGMLLYQYVYYSSLNRRALKERECFLTNDDNTIANRQEDIGGLKPMLSPRLVGRGVSYYVLGSSAKAVNAAQVGFATTASISPAQSIGHICSWICQCCYFSATIPQIYKNWRHKSTGGVSVALFASDMVGNIGYAASIIMAANVLQGNEKLEFVSKELPFLLGSSLTTLFEIVLFVQYACYPATSEVVTSVAVIEGVPEF
jgi:uncharacterized protein with PQ loop repeat